MKLVKLRSTNKYTQVTQEEYDANASLYIDRSDRPVYWLNHYLDAGFTYLQSRFYIKELVNSAVNGMDDFNTIDRDAIVEYSYGDRTKIVTHLMMAHSMSQSDATAKVGVNAGINGSKLGVDAKLITSSPQFMSVIGNFLTVINETTGELDSSQVGAYTSAIRGFKDDYETFGALGLEYGDEHEGWMDYNESTNAYLDGGLKNYTFNPSIVAMLGSEDAARLAMIAQIQELLVKGNI